ncbi:MAG TPA: ice-binding family protein [Solirubrobacteraceae bacterium]|nr:ice-binding family protein [Solirubrobacteraceae bacterium]
MPSKTDIRPCRHAGASSAPNVALLAVALVAAMALLASNALAAQAPVGLGTADSFAVLAGQTVTNIGPSAINGDLGVAPGTAVAGLLPVVGRIHAADAVAGQAQSDLTTAYDDAAGRTAPLAASADLGGLTLTAGLYNSASSIGLTGALTLDAQGDPNAVFVFQAGSTLITAAGSHVNLINGAQPCNVFWQVGSSATLGTTSVFAGTIMALTSISMNNGVTVQGRALARNGSVTLINDTINAPGCAPGTTGGGGSPSPARVGGIGAGAAIPAVPPVLGQSVSLDVRAGTVRVKGPGAPGYVALSQSASVAVGSLIDMRHGSVTLRSALPHGAVQRAVFHGGLSEVRQARDAGGLTELVLRGPLPTCTRTAARAAASSRRKPIRRLWGHDTHGKFRTRGGQSVATVRGTDWYVEDRCDGTLTRVTKGSVSVYDRRRHRSVIVRAGHSYLARAKR